MHTLIVELSRYTGIAEALFLVLCFGLAVGIR